MLASVLAAEVPHSLGFPVLAVLVLTPLVGALVIGLIPNSRPEMHRLVAIVTSIVAGALSLWVLYAFKLHDPTFQFVVRQTWVRSLDIKFYLGVDGISLFLVVLTGILFPIALFAAKPEHDEKGYYLWITLLEAGCLGVFVALDLFLFFLMFELTIVPLYFLIGRWGHGRQVYAATKFFIFTMTGSAFMLVSIVALAVSAHAGPGGHVSFDLLRDRRQPHAQHDDATVAVPRLRHRLHGEDPGVPAPHLAARRAHRGADGRVDRPRRRAVEARHLRLPALRPVPVPRGHASGPRP